MLGVHHIRALTKKKKRKKKKGGKSDDRGGEALREEPVEGVDVRRGQVVAAVVWGACFTETSRVYEPCRLTQFLEYRGASLVRNRRPP